MKRRRLSLKIKRQILPAFRAGENPDAIARRLRVDTAAVEQVIREATRRQGLAM